MIYLFALNLNHETATNAEKVKQNEIFWCYLRQLFLLLVFHHHLRNPLPYQLVPPFCPELGKDTTINLTKTGNEKRTKDEEFALKTNNWFLKCVCVIIIIIIFFFFWHPRNFQGSAKELKVKTSRKWMTFARPLKNSTPFQGSYMYFCL